MLYNLRQHWHRRRFFAASKAILKTPPIRIQDAPVCIISSVSHMDLMMYLVAIKSFYGQVRQGSIVILDDGTLTESDLKLLRQHVSPQEILRLNDVPYHGGPRKGVRWGILLAIADLVPDHFVIQLDSDTIARGALPEVDEAIRANSAFTLGTQDGQQLEPMTAVCERMKDSEGLHVQIVAEQHFDQLPRCDQLRYVRGNSGLAGFPKQAFDRELVESFYSAMTSAIGEHWLARGSFQVSSNVFVANSPGARVLPIRKYACVTPSIDHEHACFLHFIGRYRFLNNVYLTEVKALTRKLTQGEANE